MKKQDLNGRVRRYRKRHARSAGTRGPSNIKKTSLSSKNARRRPPRSRSGTDQRAEIATRLERLDELRPESAQAADLIRCSVRGSPMSRVMTKKHGPN